MRFTDRGIAALKAKPERYEVWEPGRTGLGVRVSAMGRKSWVYMYRFDGRPRRMTIGTYPAMGLAQARVKHSQARASLDKRTDPGTVHVAERAAERQAETVNELAEEYLEKYAYPRKRSAVEDERILRRYVLPKIGKRKAKSITRRDVIALLDEVAERGPIMANRTLAVVRGMFKYGVRKSILESTPVTLIESRKETPRDRALSPDEIRHLWNGGIQAGFTTEILLALKLTLATGQRPGNVAEARLRDIDLEQGIWSIPAEEAKTKVTYHVALSSLAIALIREAIALADATAEKRDIAQRSDWLFPCRYGRHGSLRAHSVGHAVRKAQEDLGLVPFTPRDLRRTTATHVEDGLRFPTDQVGVLFLNHSAKQYKGVTAVYTQGKHILERRKIQNTWARYLTLILDEKSWQAVSDHLQHREGEPEDAEAKRQDTFHRAIRAGGETWEQYVSSVCDKGAEKVVQLVTA